jgi:WD40 repeat protein
VAAAELDGRPVVISGSGDGTVRVWDLATGAPIGSPFTGHTSPVRSVMAAELDGRPVVISGSSDATMRVWDLATGAPIGDPFTGHAREVIAVAAAELDGRPVVISGSYDHTVRVWDLATGAPIDDPFTGHTDGVTAVAAAELDGRPVVISGSYDRTVRVWDLVTRRAVRHHLRPMRLRHAAPVLTAIVSHRPNGTTIVTGCSDNSSWTWDLPAIRPRLRTGIPGGSGITAITLLAPDHLIYASGRTLSLYVADLRAAPVLTIELDADVHALAAHGTSVVVATRLGLVALNIPK